jgi:hypothetical protein
VEGHVTCYITLYDHQCWVTSYVKWESLVVPSAAAGRVTGRYRRQPGVAPVTVSSRHRLLPPPSVTVTTVTAYVLVTASPRHEMPRARSADLSKIYRDFLSCSVLLRASATRYLPITSLASIGWAVRAFSPPLTSLSQVAWHAQQQLASTEACGHSCSLLRRQRSFVESACKSNSAKHCWKVVHCIARSPAAARLPGNLGGWHRVHQMQQASKALCLPG